MSQLLKTTTLENIAEGAAKEIFSHEIAKIAQNICDQNTRAMEKRTLKIEFSFHPDDQRDTIKVAVSAKTTLAGARPAIEKVWVGKDKSGVARMYAQDPAQTNLFDDDTGKIAPIKKGQKDV